MNKVLGIWILWIGCIAGCAFCLLQGWPGAVSIDMFQSVREGFDSRYAGHYDPMAAVFWKLPLLFLEMPGAVALVFVLQLLAYWAAFGLLGWSALRRGSVAVAVLLLALAWSPPFLAFSIAVESNMQVAVWWGLSMAVCMTWRRPSVLMSVLPALWFGFVARYGTVAAFVPVAYFCARITLPSWRFWKVAGCTLALAATFQAISYAVPKLVLRAPSSVSTLSISQLFDMAGVYQLTGNHWIPPWCVPEGHTVGDIIASYEVRNCVPMFWSIGGKPIFTRPKTEAEAAELRQAWWTTFKAEPMAYLTVKARFAGAFLLWTHDTCYGTGLDFSGGPHIGVQAPAEPAQHPMMRYASATASWLVWRAWVWILVVLAALVAALLARAKDLGAAVAAVLAGLGLLLPHLVFGQGASPRYLLPVYWSFTTALALVLPQILRPASRRLGGSSAAG